MIRFIFLMFLLLNGLNAYLAVSDESFCSKNCSTISINRKDKSPDLVSCSIQSYGCTTNSDVTPTEPDLESFDWYFYDEIDDKYRGIALNFSWSPGDDSSISATKGYKVTIRKPGVQETQYFCLQERLNFNQHIFAKFHYDCFGRSNKSNALVKPGQTWDIRIRSLPEPYENTRDQVLPFSIKIPKCKSKIMSKYYECYQQTLFEVYKSKSSCQNRSVTINYFVPPIYGTGANIELGEMKSGEILPTAIKNWKKSANGTFEVSIPKHYSLKNNYSILVWGIESGEPQKQILFSLADCPDENEEILTKIVISIVAFMVLVIFFGVIIKCIRRKGVKHFIQTVTNDNQFQTNSANLPGEQIQKMLEKNNKIVQVYIIFVDDHPSHKNIISSFAHFLSSDLGFQVVSELYQTKEVYPDPVDWMGKSLDESDKVIVIWSPGAAERWHRRSETPYALNDYFTPVLSRIKNKLFYDIDVNKFVFAYFDYCPKDVIPELFIKNYPTLHYKLMHQMEELYFRLKDMEMFAPGAAIKQERVMHKHYSSPEINEYGPVLEKEIMKMCDLAEREPNWYKLNQTENIPIDMHFCQSVATDHSTDGIKMNVLNIAPPLSKVEDSSLTDQVTGDQLSTSINIKSKTPMISADCLSSTALSRRGADKSDDRSNPVDSLSTCPSSFLRSCNEPPPNGVSNTKSVHSEKVDVLHPQACVLDEINYKGCTQQNSIDSGMCSTSISISEFAENNLPTNSYSSQDSNNVPREMEFHHLKLAPLELQDDAMESLIQINKLSSLNY